MQATATPRAPAFVGRLTMVSNPAGAQVFLDGKPLGTAPVAAADLRAGSHVLRMDLAGYERWSAAVQVVSNKTVNITARMQPSTSRH
jgi:hypothetical protein